LAPWIARGAARRAGIPAVWFFHGNFPPGLDRPATHAAWWYVRRVASGFARIVVSSESTGRDLERAGVERVTRIPLGVDLDTFHPRRRLAADATRAALGLPPAPAPVVAFVGRLVAEKELDLLATAWPAIARETGATLLLVGSGPREATLRLQLGRLDAPRVVWRGFESDREQVANLLAAVDLYVAPGSTETFGLAPLEALASGTPVVSAESGGVAEQVLHSGAGAVFASGNAEELGRVVVATLGQARDGTLGQLGRAYAEREHGWDMVFDRLFAMYREVLSERIAA
jgi:alpha-1,6-mannosyltransferase